VSLLKGGLAAADVVTTVSPSYAQEILTPQFGEALDGFLRHDVKRLVGIANGIDIDAWNPETDRALPARFSRTSLAGKAECRRALAQELGLSLAEHEPLIAVVARMTGQKGLDLVADLVPELHRVGAKLVVLGSGEPELESRFEWLANTFQQHVAVRIGFDIALSRRIYAGSDLFLMPSRFEPCGLGQLYAMRYGSIPVVHAVGGLRDTVSDPGDDELARGNGTGIQFHAATSSALLAALERAVKLFRDPRALANARRAAMARDSSWTASARQYVELYRSIRRTA
jgi:starch synthase